MMSTVLLLFEVNNPPLTDQIRDDPRVELSLDFEKSLDFPLAVVARKLVLPIPAGRDDGDSGVGCDR
jgi:hypothetical protein